MQYFYSNTFRKFVVGAKAYPYNWMLDHCTCGTTRHKFTTQRLSTCLAGVQAKVQSIETTKSGVKVTWDPAHTGEVPEASFSPSNIMAWNNVEPGKMASLVKVAASNKAEVLRTLHKYGFVLAEGVPDEPSTKKYLEDMFTCLQTTHFGNFWNFTTELKHQDTAYTGEFLVNHNDGTYYCQGGCPRIQALHCCEYAAKGGDSTIVDGRYICAILESCYPEHYRTLCTSNVTGEYKRDGMCLSSTRPVITPEQITYNPLDRAPMPAGTTEGFYESYALFGDMCQRPENVFNFTLRPGTVLLFDNWRVLHGRTEFTGHRKMCGAYIGNDFFKGALARTGAL